MAPMGLLRTAPCQAVEGGCSVYLLHPLVDGFDTIEEVAQRYVTQIEAISPSGPIRLAATAKAALRRSKSRAVSNVRATRSTRLS